MDLHLENKVIVVTGGAKGIGLGIVEQLAQENAIPVIVGRNQEDNLQVVQKIEENGGSAWAIQAELTDYNACQLAVELIGTKFGRIDGLVNNAGLNDGVSLEHGNYHSFVDSLHNSLVHYYLMAHHCLSDLKKSKGSILNISSKTGETGQGGTSGYAAANGGRNALTREWAVELLPYGIRVNALVVAESMTPQYENWINTLPDSQQMLRRITSRIPLENRMTTVQEIANTAAFLLSSRSSHTTGQLIHVDGGYVHLDRALIQGE